MKLTSLSWSHKASASPAREALASLRMEDILNALKLRGIGEAVAISTCNRFELYDATTA
jgi:glutamyl-tRNA reductase